MLVNQEYNIEKFIKENNFNYFGEIKNIKHTMKSGKHRGEARLTCNYTQTLSSYTNEVDMVYLWILEEDNIQKIVYAGETGKTVLERWEKGHRGAFIKNPMRPKQKKLWDMLQRSKTIKVKVYAKYAKQQQIMGESVSLRHAEEIAIINKFNPELNYSSSQ
jgi:hypothetical protein